MLIEFVWDFVDMFYFKKTFEDMRGAERMQQKITRVNQASSHNKQEK